MLDIKPLRYFVALAETRHFGRAASQLNLTQPPLSRQLMALEQALGVKLIERNPRSVRLTAAGEQFYHDAKALLAALEQAAQNARAAESGDSGKLEIGFTMCAAYSVVPAYARAYAAAFPNVALSLREVVSNDLTAQLSAGRIDAAVMFLSDLPAGLATRSVLREPLCVALSRNHPLARARRIDIAQLAGEVFVMATEQASSSLRTAIVGHCRQGGFEPNVGFEVQLQHTVLGFVDEGVGIALVPASMRKAQLAGVTFKTLAAAPVVELVLVWSRTNRNPCLAHFLGLAETAPAPMPG